MQAELGWSDARVDEEMTALRRAYVPVTRDRAPTPQD
jgi:hypothetical protein